MDGIKNYKSSMRAISVAYALILLMSGNIFGACYGDAQRGGGFLGSPRNCTWKRSDNRCNDNSECCPGEECSSITGQCQPCCRDCQ